MSTEPNTSDQSISDERIEPTLGADIPDVEIVQARPKSFAGSPTSRWGMIVGAIVGVIFLGVFAYSYLQPKPDTDRARLASVRTGEGSGAVNTPTPRQQALVMEENRRAAEQALQDPRGVVVPPLTGGPSEPVNQPPPPPPAYPVTPVRQAPPPKQVSTVEYVSQLAANAATIRALTRIPLGHVTAFAQPAMTATIEADSDGEPQWPGGLFPVGEKLLATLDIGVDSDFDQPVSAVILSPHRYRGIRLIGSFVQPSRWARDRVAIRFTEAFPDPYGPPVRVNAIAVDPGARIPALKGKTDYHLLENLVFHVGASFVQGYAQGLATQSLAAVNLGNDTSFLVANPLDPGITGAARAVQSMTSSRGMRPPTVRIPAGTAIGVIVLAQDTRQQVATNSRNNEPGATSDPASPVFVDAPLPTRMIP
jgi:hypothetical protein